MNLIECYSPLRAFGLAMACVTWAAAIESSKRAGVPTSTTERIARQYARWSLHFMWPDYYILPGAIHRVEVKCEIEV